jgi:hypothetical protein
MKFGADFPLAGFYRGQVYQYFGPDAIMTVQP